MKHPNRDRILRNDHLLKLEGSWPRKESVFALIICGLSLGWWGQATTAETVAGCRDKVANDCQAPLVSMPASGQPHLVPQNDAAVVAWGNNQSGQTDIPEGLSHVTAITAGDDLSLALLHDGQLIEWGIHRFGQLPESLLTTKVVAVAAGADHNMALTRDGQVVAWGNNYFGQINVPSGLSNVVAIAAGASHSLALTADGLVTAWGAGDSSPGDHNRPGQSRVPIGLSNVVAVAAGGYHSLALTASRQIVAWGDNRFGQTTLPPGLSNVIAIAAGGLHSVALTAERQVIAWGINDSGQTAVPTGLSNVIAIAAGGRHSLALTATGQDVAWGNNQAGQTSVPDDLDHVIAIAAGESHSLALTGGAIDGDVPAWITPRTIMAVMDRPLYHQILVRHGASAFGISGLPPGLILDPNTGLISGFPTKAGIYPASLSATNRAGTSSWQTTFIVNQAAAPGIESGGLIQASLGSGFMFSLKAHNGPEWFGASGLPRNLVINEQSGVISGLPLETGDFPVTVIASNRYGVDSSSLTLHVSPVTILGDNPFNPTLVTNGLTNIISIAVGGDAFGSHFLALTAEGQVTEWGSQLHGYDGSVPAVAIAAGSKHRLALTMEGRVIAWGDNQFGQTNVPSGLSNVVAIAAGDYHSLALTDQGRIVSWGGNDYGQVNVPTGLNNIIAIAAGHGHSLALTAEGRIEAWGAGSGPILERPHFGQSRVPMGLSNVVAIAAGGNHSLALTAEGQVIGWGFNWYGITEMPEGLSNVIAIAAGEAHNVALTSEGRVAAWGNNQNGQTNVSNGLSNVVCIAAGYLHSMALTGLPPGLSAPSWIGPRILVAFLNRAFHHRLVAKNGVTAYQAVGLPPGLDLDSTTGLISGRPTQAGTFSIDFIAENQVGSTTWKTTLYVNETALPVITSQGFYLLTLGQGFNFPIQASNGPEWYGASGLPKGMSVDALSGLISGVPLETGDFEVSQMASNRAGVATNSLSWRVSPLAAWGCNRYGESTSPAGLDDVVAIAAGGRHSLALTAQGHVRAWGHNGYGQSTVPDHLSNVVAIAAGTDHSLALTADGRVTAWGARLMGSTDFSSGLSNLLFSVISVPKGLSNVVAIAAGDLHNLALNDRGQVTAWGIDNYGKLNVPIGLSNVIAIAAGCFHSLALTAEGQVIGWGAGMSNTGRSPDYGQSQAPSGLSRVVAIAAGSEHSLALKADGRVVAWGSNRAGQTNLPPGLSNVIAIAASGAHNLALTSEGRVMAWGSNSKGESAVPNGLSNVVALAAGGIHSLALSSLPPGVAPPARVGPQLLVAAVDRPWQFQVTAKNGVTAYGAAGLPPGLTLDGKTGLIAGKPMHSGIYPVTFSATNTVGSSAWTATLYVFESGAPVVTNRGVTDLGLGNWFHYPVVAQNGAEWYGASGLPPGLSIHHQSGIISGTPEVAGDFPVSLLASNRLGLQTGSMTLRVSPVVAWGAGAADSLGVDNHFGQCQLPGGLSNVVALAAGPEHSLALTREGRVFSWGRWDQTTVPDGASNLVAIAAGLHHSLGITADRRIVSWGGGKGNAPLGLSNVVAIAAGKSHSLALTVGGEVVAWGEGTEYNPDSSMEGRIMVPSGLRDVVAIAAGWDHSVALTSEGKVVAWGGNERGQTDVPGSASNIISIAAGGWHNLALTSQGRIVAWGDNRSGQISVPSELSNVVAIAAGGKHSVALTSQGQLVAWGDNRSSQSTVPGGLCHVVSIVAGSMHNLALLDQPAVSIPRLAWDRGSVGLELNLHGARGICGQLLRASDCRGPWLPDAPVAMTNCIQPLQAPDMAELAKFLRFLRK